jgi:hypothetical protein
MCEVREDLITPFSSWWTHQSSRFNTLITNHAIDLLCRAPNPRRLFRKIGRLQSNGGPPHDDK